MAAPRFRLRSLVLLIAFLAMALTIGILTVQNQRFRAEVQQARAEAIVARERAELERVEALMVRAAAQRASQAPGGK
jgi:cell division protein FtsB